MSEADIVDGGTDDSILFVSFDMKQRGAQKQNCCEINLRLEPKWPSIKTNVLFLQVSWDCHYYW